jgi:RND family efflux transporter MFP subunit
MHFDASGRKTLVAGYILVGLLALGAGVAGTLLVQRNMAPGGGAAPAAGGHEEMAPSRQSDASTSAAASGAVFIPVARQQLIGVRTTEAAHRTVARRIRTVGTLAIDETRQAQIHTKVAGWAEHVSVDFVGRPVRRGQPLFSIYSPELVATQKEYLLALRAEREFAASEFEETRASGQRLVAAARERLRLWDITDAQIAELEHAGEARRTVTIVSPVSGIVTERNVYTGQYVSPDLMAFKIADLSGVWAIGEVFEYELPFVRPGQAVTVEFPYAQASAPLKGRVAYIYPDVDPRTRRGRIRVDVPNPGLAFKPGTFVTLNVDAPGETALVVPREAVIDTGTTQYVILAKEGGFFEPREVTVGTPAGDVYPVTSGLSHGDRVVTSAQFLVDSETNLQAAMKAMVGHGDMGGMTMPDEPASAGKPRDDGQDMEEMPGMDHAKQGP